MPEIKILHIVGSMNRAGQETFLMNVFRNINREKFSFFFLYNNDKIKSDYDKEINNLGGIIVASNKKRFKLFHHLKRNITNYDILYIPSNNAFLALYNYVVGKYFKIPKIIIHSHSTSSKHKMLNYFGRFFLRFINVNKLACSKEAAKWLYGSNLNKVIIINNGINPSDYIFDINQRAKIRKELGIEDELAIVHIGRFVESKNHVFIVKILAEIINYSSKVKLILVGEGKLKNKIDNLFKQKGLSSKVIFAGIQENIPQFLMGMDVFILPSLYEGLPVTAIEGQASGVSCYLSDRITAEAKLTPSLEFLPINDPNIWAQAIINHDNSYHIDNAKIIECSEYNIRNVVDLIETIYSNSKLQ